jgi:hypothetical protein
MRFAASLSHRATSTSLLTMTPEGNSESFIIASAA